MLNNRVAPGCGARAAAIVLVALALPRLNPYGLHPTSNGDNYDAVEVPFMQWVLVAAHPYESEKRHWPPRYPEDLWIFCENVTFDRSYNYYYYSSHMCSKPATSPRVQRKYYYSVRSFRKISKKKEERTFLLGPEVFLIPNERSAKDFLDQMFNFRCTNTQTAVVATNPILYLQPRLAGAPLPGDPVRVEEKVIALAYVNYSTSPRKFRTGIFFPTKGISFNAMDAIDYITKEYFKGLPAPDPIHECIQLYLRNGPEVENDEDQGSEDSGHDDDDIAGQSGEAKAGDSDPRGKDEAPRSGESPQAFLGRISHRWHPSPSTHQYCKLD